MFHRLSVEEHCILRVFLDGLPPENLSKKHVKWSKRKWNKVLFTDESKFELFGNKRRVIVRRMPGKKFKKECLTPTVKHAGGSIMVWGGIFTSGVTRLKRMEGIMDKQVYHNILVRTTYTSRG
jgi:hypothetical protein